MSALSFLCLYSQTPACQACVLALATGAVAWCVKRHILKTGNSTMASTGKDAAHCDAGPSNEPSTSSKRPTYADALRATGFPGSKMLLKQRNEILRASIQARHFPLPRKSIPAAHQVFGTSELLAMILANLPLASDRSAMTVSKHFWVVLNPGAESHLCGIKEALGIKFSRSIESLTASEKADLWAHIPVLMRIPKPRLDWLVNIELDTAFVLSRRGQFLKIAPFVSDGLLGCLEHRTLHANLRLDAEDVDRNFTEWKGVRAVRQGQGMLYSNKARDVARNWMDVKLAKMPFEVQVSVAVDFRKAMGAPSHHEGGCRVPGCVVGLHGVQYTTTTLQPEKATLGEFIKFLDLVEHDTRTVAATIARRALRYGPGPHGDNYYLGSSVSPPRLAALYTGEYIIDASPWQPSSLSLDQMTPRTLRDFLFQDSPPPTK